MRHHESNPTDKKDSKSKLKHRATGLLLAGAALTGVGCAPNGHQVDTITSPTDTELTHTPTHEPSQEPSQSVIDNNGEADNSSGNYIQSFPNQETITSDGNPVAVFTNEQGEYSVKDAVFAWMKDENIWLVTGNEAALAAFTPRPADYEEYNLDIPNTWNLEQGNRESFLEQTGYQAGEQIPTSAYYTNIDQDSVDYSPPFGATTMTVEYVTTAKNGRVDRHRYNLVFGTTDTMPVSPNKAIVFTDVYSADRIPSTN